MITEVINQKIAEIKYSIEYEQGRVWKWWEQIKTKRDFRKLGRNDSKLIENRKYFYIENKK